MVAGSKQVSVRVSGRGAALPASAEDLLREPAVWGRLNDVDPQAWLADVLARIAAHPVQQLGDLLPWNWRKSGDVLSQAA